MNRGRGAHFCVLRALYQAAQAYLGTALRNFDFIHGSLEALDP